MNHSFLKICLSIALSVTLLTGLSACGGGGGSSSGSVTIGESWTLPSSLTNDALSVAGQDAQSVQVATDNNGNAIVAWQQSNGSTQQAYMSEYRNGGWTHPTDLVGDAISVGGQYAFPPQLAMDDNGNALIVWQQLDGADYQIYKSEYRNGAWTHPTSLASDAISFAGRNAYNPSVAMDNNGNALITWGQSDGSKYRIYKSAYRSGSWTHPSDPAADAISVAGQNAYNPQVAMNDSDEAMIAWEQSDGTNFRIHKSEYRGGSWSHPVDLNADALSSAGQDAYSPRVAIDNNGDALIVWQQLKKT